ncbi:MAG: rhodanese-like domain-containing protein [Pseudomonadota bacterium]|uniref:rhodanese-like domain-containing protein n=1 Tax=Phenylobacterium sp. TaxID=1871053 RepID=UPI0025DEBC58|nr:rhodanese-like domain-containing protein [Phenylobacterium sp.]MBT9471713.1 rhodanese-like domain-containing protein [Phenylobacterium sp.]
MPTSVKDLLAAANEAVPRISPAEAKKLIAHENALVVDVRDPPEVAATGKVKGAINISRGMIEFRADSDTASYDPAFQKDRPIILYCASGGRSALAGKALKEMGYGRVQNLGGFKDASEGGLDIEPA